MNSLHKAVSPTTRVPVPTVARRLRGLMLALMLAPLAAAPAAAQDTGSMQALNQKLERLQGELNDLQRTVYSDGETVPKDPPPWAKSEDGESGNGSGSGLSSAAAQRLSDRIESLETDVRRVTGQLEQARHDLKKATERLDKLVADVDYRLRELETFRRKAERQLAALTGAGEGGDAADTADSGSPDSGSPDSGSPDSGRADEPTATADAAGDSGANGDTGAGTRPGTTGDGDADGTDEGQASGSQTASSGASGESGDASGTLGQVSQDAVEELRQQANRGDEAGLQSGSDSGNGDSAEGATTGNGDAGSGGASSSDDAGQTQAASKPASGGILPDTKPRLQYEHAFGLLRQADYAKAENALRAFVEAHPQHALAGNAKYWLGETYYVRENYQQAAVTFAEGFRSYPESRKAPDNLLKLGMSLAEIDKTDKACQIFSQLRGRFPDAAKNILQRAKREQSRLQCGG